MVKGLSAQHKLAGVPACIVLLVHDAHEREEVPVARRAAAGGHIGGHHQRRQRRRVQPDESALLRVAVCGLQEDEYDQS